MWELILKEKTNRFLSKPGRILGRDRFKAGKYVKTRTFHVNIAADKSRAAQSMSRNSTCFFPLSCDDPIALVERERQLCLGGVRKRWQRATTCQMFPEMIAAKDDPLQLPSPLSILQEALEIMSVYLTSTRSFLLFAFIPSSLPHSCSSPHFGWNVSTTHPIWGFL